MYFLSNMLGRHSTFSVVTAGLLKAMQSSRSGIDAFNFCRDLKLTKKIIDIFIISVLKNLYTWKDETFIK